MFGEFVVVSIALSFLKGVSLLVSYINNNAFPKPLSRQDEAHYLKILSESKTKQFTMTPEVEKARNTLVEHNLRLVAHIVKQYDGTEEDVDDLISIGTIGLIKGINTFDPSKGIKLDSYAGKCIENEILMYFRAKRKSKGEISMSGKGLARYWIPTRFQPLPIRTAREVFPQAAHPINFIIRVMRPIEW
ncbi:hypothetical protein SBF1_8870001 [Candidatus Desulfosporosinus infrequens]|uniref:RNA polymerase sigma-70 domain-containing protein n=1 Tax=Candidatus Desulfosporosinus infrequens TaxID=2043169 RepID=A0A2U3LWG3_9FIRM|nr:hypothetical protein SBF1_8870001 [Candidatus Desulfosporosinus infrequens]